MRDEASFKIDILKAWILSWVKHMDKKEDEEIIKYKKLSDKHFQLYMLMVQWVKLKQEGKNLATPLLEKGIKHVAIYGMNYVGERLLEELNESGVTVDYAIDKNADKLYCYVDLLKPDDTLPKVDAVIVTPITYFDSIESFLTKKMACPILSIDDLMFE